MCQDVVMNLCGSLAATILTHKTPIEGINIVVTHLEVTVDQLFMPRKRETHWEVE